MADQAAKDTASQERIIKHLNADHSNSLSLYLQHYNHLSASAARNAQIIAISLSTISLKTTDGRTHTIPFNPPMTSYADARQRSVDMDNASRAALGISKFKVTAYEPPKKPFHIFVFGICLFTMGIFATKNKIVPGTTFYDDVLKYWPGGPEIFLKIANAIAPWVIAIHVGECAWLQHTRLKKYSVETGSGLWCRWMASCLIEGFGCFARIDAQIKKKEKEAEKAKH